MKRLTCFVVLFCCVASVSLVAQARPLPGEVKTFELYSWQDAKARWTFSLFPAITNAGIHPDVIMRPSSALTGQEKLKRAIATLPSGSEILWLDHAVGMWKDAKGWQRIKFPPAEVIADVRKFCEARGFKLSVEQAKSR